MKGLAPQTTNIFEKVSQLKCIEQFVLVGGTALSIQIGTRQSEDLDFMRWKSGRNDRLEVDWPRIKKELSTIGNIESVDVLGLDMVEFVVDDVKLSFYAAPRKQPTSLQKIHCKNSLYLADIKSIGGMKMETMLRRSKFRDYYDIYSILRSGVNINDLIDIALEHSGHVLKKRNILAILSDGERFRKDEAFAHLNPIYDVTSADIENYIKELLLEEPYK